MKKELWDNEEKELLESTRRLWDNELISFYKIARDLRERTHNEPFVKKLLLSLGYLRGKKFKIGVFRSTNALRLKVVDWDESFLRIPLPKTYTDVLEEEFIRDQVYTTLINHGFGEKISQYISDSEIEEVG